MNKDEDTETEILAKLGILNSTLESPNKMTKTENRRRAAMNMLAASSLSDDSDSEIIFDRNALLAARRRRRQRSSTRITNILNNETLKWKIFCLCATFLCLGLSNITLGLTKPDIMANVNTNNLIDYAKIFVFGGFGYLIGSIFVCVMFTRVNEYICVLFLFGISIPFTTLVIYQTDLGTVKFFMLCQGVMFGAIERGAFLIVYGLLNGNKRVLFLFYMLFAFGAGLSWVLTTDDVFSHVNVIRQKAHLMAKREIVNINQPLQNNFTLITEEQSVTRPHSVIGANEDPNTKTRENSEKRKQAQIAKESAMTEKPTVTSTTKTPLPTTVKKTSTISTTIKTTQPPSNQDTQTGTAAQFVYLIIMAISLVTVLLFLIGFCACCVRCNLVADFRITQTSLDASKNDTISYSVLALSVLCWFLQSLPETIIIAFLPHYLMNSINMETLARNHVFFVSSFWFVVTVFRLFAVTCSEAITSKVFIKICYYFAIICSFLLHYIFSSTSIASFIGLLALGGYLLTVPQMTFMWMQSELDASPYLLSKYYFISVSLSKISGPLLTVWALTNWNFTTLMTGIMILSLLVFTILSRFVNPLARQRQILELSGDINGRKLSAQQASSKQKNRKGQYEALIENQSDEADVEMDYVMTENVLASDSDSI